MQCSAISGQGGLVLKEWFVVELLEIIQSCVNVVRANRIIRRISESIL